MPRPPRDPKNTGLADACHRCDLAAAQRWLDQGADPNGELDAILHNPLENAAASGCLDIVRLLVERGAKIPFFKGMNSAEYAAEQRQHVEVANYLKQLRQLKATVQNQLFGAIRRCDAQEVRKKLDAGADLNTITEEEPRTPLYVALTGGCQKLAGDLIERGAHVQWLQIGETSHQEPYGPLHLAAQKGYADLVKMILKKRPDPNARGHWDKTPLMLAAQSGERNVVTQLMEACANPQLTDMLNRNASQLAILAHHPEIIALMKKIPPQCDGMSWRPGAPGGIFGVRMAGSDYKFNCRAREQPDLTIDGEKVTLCSKMEQEWERQPPRF
jgi:ankyrin repeat protein